MRRILVFISTFLTSFCFASSPPPRLVLVGGGVTRPGIERIVQWGGGKNARILVVTWASDDPNFTYGHLSKNFGSFSPDSVEEAVRYEDLIDAENELVADHFLDSLNRVTAVFFSGGSQDRIMEVLKKYPAFEKRIRQQFESGVVFGGTSAGTAIMSRTMLTCHDGSRPEEFRITRGLGLLPPNIIVDQHFDTRPFRETRLKFSLERDSRASWGVGIYESAVLAVDGNEMEVIAGKVQLFRKAVSERLETIFSAGVRMPLPRLSPDATPESTVFIASSDR